MRTTLFAVSAIIFVFLFTAGKVCAQNLYINLVAVNGAEDAKDTPLKYYLPSELKPEDIVSTGDLKVDFDLERSQYYVSGSFLLQPKESKAFKVEVRDVWKVNLADIDIIKDQLSKNLELLKDSPTYDSAVMLQGVMVNKLDYILRRQDEFATNVERRIEEYRANLATLQELKQNAFNLEYLQSAVAEPEKEGTVKMVLEVENPKKNENNTIVHKHYLPEEVRLSDIVDAQGFDVRYDPERKQCYLTKEEEFLPSEKKRYIIMIRNTWYIPKPMIDSLEDRTKKAIEGITKNEEGKSYERSASFLSEKIFNNLNQIRDAQNVKRDVKDDIGIYRVNRGRYREADQTLKELERLLAIVTAQRMKKLEDLDKSKVTNVLQKIRALRGISAISKALFGTRPTITATWRIIWGTLAFVAIFTAIHFFTWRARSQYMGEENAAETKGQLKEVGAPEDETTKKS
ncbi:MAG TPA: hypothetical protein PKO44_07720 [Candidatus Omnitrophota bacterium]|nr:hypothetical protein [Candidatus Omnitrophota bacterium]